MNYGLALIDQLDIRLGNQHTLPGACAYVSRRGVFAPNGKPLRIDAFSVEKSAMPLANQSQVLGHLQRLVGAQNDLSKFIHAHVDSKDCRQTRVETMQENSHPTNIPNMGWIEGEETGPQAELPPIFGY